MIRFSTIFTGVLCLLVLGGCASTPNAGRPQRLTGDPMVDGQTAVSQGPAKDKVLWQYRMALTALRRGQYDEAKRQLDDAILTISGVPANDRSARKARSYFSSESRKTFFGEPYERVMAYFYRGVLYWMDGEPDNARACFRTAQLLDADSEQKDYACDYVLLDYLDGLATEKLAGDGSDSLKRAQASAKNGAPVPYDRNANVLFFVEFGKGPVKYATGAHSEQLRFRNAPSAASSASITVSNRTVIVMPNDDLVYQATTRGGRSMDHILANKAVFKNTTDTIGDAAIISGAVMGSHQGRNSNVDEIGLGLVAFGIINKIVAASATPAADTRSWDNLPRYLSFASLSLPPGTYSGSIEFKDTAGRVLSKLTRSVSFTVPPAGRDAVIFVSDQS